MTFFAALRLGERLLFLAGKHRNNQRQSLAKPQSRKEKLSVVLAGGSPESHRSYDPFKSESSRCCNCSQRELQLFDLAAALRWRRSSGSSSATAASS